MKELADDLAGALGAVVSKSDADRTLYARDLWPRHLIDVRDGEVALHKPAAIVWPRNTEEVASIVERCAREGTPLVPYGAGSGVCGGVLPDPNAIILDLKCMNAVRMLDRERPVVDVEAGALGIRFEEDLQAQGFTLGHFPSSILCSTVGGWVAARSAGQCSGLYGKIEDMIAHLSIAFLPAADKPRLMANFARFRIAANYRVAGHDYRTFASGHCHCVMFNKLMPWDHLPGALISEEAGGHVRKFDGSPYRPADLTGGLLLATDANSWSLLRREVFTL